MRRMMIPALVLCAAFGWYSVSGAQSYRGTQESNDAIAPATTVFDTSYATSSGVSDTLNFGFYANWISGEVYTAACSLAYYYDSSLSSTWTATTDTITWASGRNGIGTLRLDPDLWNVPAAATFYYDVKTSALIVKGTGTGTIHIQAGGGGVPTRKGP